MQTNENFNPNILNQQSAAVSAKDKMCMSKHGNKEVTSTNKES
jgi:hypothetical protein